MGTVNGDVTRARDCNHPVCRSCMAAFVVGRVEEQRVFGILCPIEGCSNEVQQQDVDELVRTGALATKVGDRFADLRKQEYTSRILELCDDPTSLAVVGREVRLCPRCSVIIQKKSGCNSF